MDDESVGYGNPPKHGQFQKGKSGNPKGRPRKKHTFSELIREALERQVSVELGHKAQNMSTLEAIIYSLVHLAAKGDMRALATLLRIRNYERPGVPSVMRFVEPPGHERESD